MDTESVVVLLTLINLIMIIAFFTQLSKVSRALRIRETLPLPPLILLILITLNYWIRAAISETSFLRMAATACFTVMLAFYVYLRERKDAR